MFVGGALANPIMLRLLFGHEHAGRHDPLSKDQKGVIGNPVEEMCQCRAAAAGLVFDVVRWALDGQ